jgi:hypothetical protein
MTGILAALGLAYLAGMALVGMANAIESSGRLIDGAQELLDEGAEVWPPLWLTDLNITDDGADAPRSPATEAAQRQALALDAPDPAFIARTRDLVVDELARRRSVTS